MRPNITYFDNAQFQNINKHYYTFIKLFLIFQMIHICIMKQWTRSYYS